MSINLDPLTDAEYPEMPPAFQAPPAVMKLRRLSEIKTPPATKWLARGWLPYSELTVLVGEEGLGKSLLWVRVAAHVTTGRADPTMGIPARPARDVVVIVTEDNPGEVESRLNASGADLDRVFILCSEKDGTGSPVFGNSSNGGDMATLDAHLGEIDAALVVVDAWVDTVAGSLTLKDGQQARQAMHPWKVIAQRHAASVVLMTHTNRMNTSNTRDLMGSTAVLRQKARMVLFAARSPEDKENGGEHVWVGPDKSNVTGLSDALKYRLDIVQTRERSDDDPGTTARLVEPISAAMPIGQLVDTWHQEQGDGDKKPTKGEQVRTVLVSLVKDAGGSILSTDLKDKLHGLGFGKTVAQEAMKALGASAPLEPRGPWYFSLNEGQSQWSDPITSGTSEIGKLGKLGNIEDPIYQYPPSQANVPSLNGAPAQDSKLSNVPSLNGPETNGSRPVTLDSEQECAHPMTPYLRETYGKCFDCQAIAPDAQEAHCEQ